MNDQETVHANPDEVEVSTDASETTQPEPAKELTPFQKFRMWRWALGLEFRRRRKPIRREREANAKVTIKRVKPAPHAARATDRHVRDFNGKEYTIYDDGSQRRTFRKLRGKARVKAFKRGKLREV